MAISADKIELLGTLLETILYGCSLVMFVASIWSLLSRRSTNPVNHGMFIIAILFVLLSTAHVVVHMIRIMNGLILFRNTFPGGPIKFFTIPVEWTLYVKFRIYIIQTLLGDAVIIFRCYMVWQSILVTMFPVLLWCAAAVTGIIATVIKEKQPRHYVPPRTIHKWATGFWSLALATTVLATALLIFRIWSIDRKVKKHGINQPSHLRKVLRITIDAGAIYSLTCLIGLVSFMTRAGGQTIVTSLIPPLIAMMFYMVIIRVGLITWDWQGSLLMFATTMEGDQGLGRGRRVRACTPMSTEGRVDHQSSSSYVMDTVNFDHHVGPNST